MVGLVTNLAATSNITLQKYLPMDELSKRFFVHALPFFQVVNERPMVGIVFEFNPGGTEEHNGL